MIDNPIPSPDPASKTEPPLRRLKLWRSLFGILGVLLVGVLAVLAWVVLTNTGLRYLAQALPVLTGDRLSVGAVQGKLWGHFALTDLNYVTPTQHIELTSVDVVWDPGALWRREWHIQHIKVGNVLIQKKEKAPEPIRAPRSLHLPFAIKLDQFEAASITLPDNIHLYDTRLRYQYDLHQHKLNIQQLYSPWGNAVAILQAKAAYPFGLQGKVTLKGALEGVPYQAGLQLAGSLIEPEMVGHVSGYQLMADVTGKLNPFSPNPFQRFIRLDARLAGVNPQAILPDWPKAELNVALFATPEADGQIKGGFAIQNRQPGTISDHHLPLSIAAGAFHSKGDQLVLSDTQVTLGGGHLQAAGSVAPDKLDLTLSLSAIELTELYKTIPNDTINGTIHLAGKPSWPRLTAKLDGKWLHTQTQLSWKKQEQNSITVEQLVLQADNAYLKGTGTIGLDGNRPIQLTADLKHVNPARFQPTWPVGDINLKASVQGNLSAPMQFKAGFAVQPSTLSGAPLSGNGQIWLDDKTLKQADVKLRLANNLLNVQGAYGRAKDKLLWQVDVPNLGLIGSGFSGRIHGKGELSGLLDAPFLQADLQADQLRLPGLLTVRHLAFNGEVRSDNRAPFKAQLEAEGIKTDVLTVDRLNFKANGTLAHHSIQGESVFALNQQPYDLRLMGDGSWQGKTRHWQGKVSELNLKGKPNIQLLAPMGLEVSAQRIQLGSASFRALGGQITLAEFARTANGQLRTRGHAQGISLETLPLSIKQSLIVNANWDINLGAKTQGGFVLQRTGGDVFWLASSGLPAVALGIKKAQLQGQLQHNRLYITTDLDTRFAQLTGEGSMPWIANRTNGRTPITAQLHWVMPQLRQFQSFVGSGLGLDGQASGDITLSGPLEKPLIHGTMKADKLLFRDYRTGIQLENGHFSATIRDQFITIDQLQFSSKQQGTLTASGTLDLTQTIPDTQINFTIDRFSVFNNPHRLLIVSGQTHLSIAGGHLALSGKIRADRGRVDLPKLGTPALSSDVIVEGQPLPEPSAFANMPLKVDLYLDLGNRFRFVGQGLTVDLEGGVRVYANPGSPPGAQGEVRITKGRYKAYGQDLDIAQGNITFSGELDNPSLYVRAVRRLSEVGAGVEVTGTVSSPRIRLVSDEPMTDKEKLAWLVLGRPAGGSQDDQALAASAGALLVGSLNNRLGFLDDLGISTRPEKIAANGSISPAEQVLTVGRQLTREVYLGYEYGVTSASQALKIAYSLSRNWSVILKTGTDTSVESRYTLRFD